MPKNKEGPVKSHQFCCTRRCQGNTLGWCCPSRTFLVLPLMGFGQERRGQSHVAGMWLPHLGARPGGQDGTLLRIGHQTTGEDVVITAPPSANGGAPDSLCAVSSLRSFFRGDAPRVTQPAFFPERGHGVCSWRPCLVFMLQ